MKKRKCSSVLKCFAVDILMLLLFVMLVSFTLWVLWMYFLRGPIDMETRGYVSKTLKEVSIQPTDIERYTLQHFHNLDDVVLKGIEYPSTCITCHGDYPHTKTPKVRAFFNAHSWFIACEVCHRDNAGQKNVSFKWLDNDTDIALYKLEGDRGIYGARIVPVFIENATEYRLDNLTGKDVVETYRLTESELNDSQKKTAMEKIHSKLNAKAVSCDQCHTDKSLFDFRDLLYSDNMATHLKTIDVGSMISGYDIFHFPNIYESRD